MQFTSFYKLAETKCKFIHVSYGFRYYVIPLSAYLCSISFGDVGWALRLRSMQQHLVFLLHCVAVVASYRSPPLIGRIRGALFRRLSVLAI